MNDDRWGINWLGNFLAEITGIGFQLAFTVKLSV